MAGYERASGRAAAALPLLVALDLSPERPVRTSCAPPWRPRAGAVGADMHYALEFGVVVSGSMHRNHGAGWFRVGVGQAWATASLEAHHWRVGRNMQYVVFQFLPFLLDRLPILSGLDLTAPFRLPLRRNVIGHGRQFCRSLAEAARGLLPNYQDAVLPGETFMDMLRILHPISTYVLQHSEPATPGVDSLSSHSVAPAVERVQRTADRIVSVDEAAEACHMARRTFCRSFRTTMGISFGEFALRWRLVCAAHSLKSSDKPVKAIAHQFGFHGAGHLHRMFHARYGISPTQYRTSSRVAEL